ncbi:MAG: tetratricopeptide repeat protein [Limnobacter sp.]|uniref:tetratricopeptide repeat protein n=1 Tax=Limnobacter sp. TaxID=2003368 RepID=UPI00391B8ECD
MAQPDTSQEAPNDSNARDSSVHADLGEIRSTESVEQAEVVVKGERLETPASDLAGFLLESLKFESKHGPPERFLSNVARLIRLGVVQSSQVIDLQAEAAKRSTNRASKQLVASLLEENLSSAENRATRHRLLGDLYFQLGQFSSAVQNYDQALQLNTNPTEAHFIEDSKDKAMRLMRGKSK